MDTYQTNISLSNYSFHVIRCIDLFKDDIQKDNDFKKICMFCNLQVETSQPWWDLFLFNMYPGCSLWPVLAFVKHLLMCFFSIVQCFIPWDGGCRNTAGLYWIFTYKISNSHFLKSIFYLTKKCKTAFPPLSLPFIIFVFLPAGKYPHSDEGGNGWDASVWKKDSEDRTNLYLWEGGWEVLSQHAGQAKWTFAAYFEFVKRWYPSQKHSLSITTHAGVNIDNILHQPPAI